MKEPDATPWIDRKSIVLVALTAIVTTVASEGVKNWLPSIVSYGWNVATKAKVVYVTVAYGTPPRNIADARVAIFDPEKNSVVREWSTNASGMAVLHDIDTPKFFLTASFAAGDKLVRAQKYIQIVEYPTNTVFGKEDTWAVSDITVNATNIETPSTQNISGKPEPNDPPWLRVALAEVGVTRKLGEESNPRIVEYNASTTLGPLSDKTPWGCSFVSWVFQQSQTKGNLRSARCVDWLRFGSPIADAKRGAVAIFSPIVSEATSGFVGFVLSADDKNVNLVVGNINHSVALASFPRASVRGYRWPVQ
jgi:uncharacterized protein (TIGR02594 family)